MNNLFLSEPQFDSQKENQPFVLAPVAAASFFWKRHFAEGKKDIAENGTGFEKKRNRGAPYNRNNQALL